MVRLAPVSPTALDYTAYAIFRRVNLGGTCGPRELTPQQLVSRSSPLALHANTYIPKYGFLAVVPLHSASLSVLNCVDDTGFSLRVGPHNYGDQFWHGFNWGNFCFIVWLTRALHTGRPNLAGYLNGLLPAPRYEYAAAVARDSLAAMAEDAFVCHTNSIAAECGLSQHQFGLSFLRVMTAVKHRGVPLWSVHGDGHSYFAKSQLARDAMQDPSGDGGGGDVLCLCPFLDICSHSVQPNAAIGTPDADVVQYIKQERRLEGTAYDDIMVLQALKDIGPGEEIRVDRNESYQFDAEAFEDWFGEPLEAAAAATSKSEVPRSGGPLEAERGSDGPVRAGRNGRGDRGGGNKREEGEKEEEGNKREEGEKEEEEEEEEEEGNKRGEGEGEEEEEGNKREEGEKGAMDRSWRREKGAEDRVSVAELGTSVSHMTRMSVLGAAPAAATIAGGISVHNQQEGRPLPGEHEYVGEYDALQAGIDVDDETVSQDRDDWSGHQDGDHGDVAENGAVDAVEHKDGGLATEDMNNDLRGPTGDAVVQEETLHGPSAATAFPEEDDDGPIVVEW